ncbi:hypothetical protein DES38_10647 [Streptohalobacillus salinus]|uniref:HTH marR-type domain-containing protein n=1 Tax=Streptohalobacillus salinus TaxID=621096 RepID=A0A2V3W9H5_9BACI|nr:hypothetical protein DES38_10647 [Streptohalobacillus salinus]
MISRFFKIAKPSETATLKRLIKAGYLYKEANQADRRSDCVLTTEKGEQFVDATFDTYLASIQHLHDAMGEEDFYQLIKLMQQANQTLEEMTV